jgi:hypothetical protein
MTVLGWLVQRSDTHDFVPCWVEQLKQVAIGERDDCVWARLSPPLETAERESLDTVLLVPRFANFSFAEPLTVPMHVFVCTPATSTSELPDALPMGSIRVRCWAVLSPVQPRPFA